MYINELSQKLRLSKKAIRIYEEKGFIHPLKNHLGYRLYTKEDQQILLRIQQLRHLQFSLDEIKEILINHHYEVLGQKKEKYQEDLYHIDTSLQFLDEIKECLKKDDDMTELSHKMNSIYDLKNIKSSDIIIDFDKIIFIMMIFAVFLALKSQQNDIWEGLSMLMVLLSIVLYFSSTVRVMIYKIYQKVIK